jgi:hypothetical protein
MTTWSAVVDAAVVGAGRGGLPETAAVLAPLTTRGPDAGARLLDTAAAVSRARRAGYRPASAGDLAAPEPAEPDGRPPVSPPAARRLGQLLAGERGELVMEWLRLLAGTGRRPPDVLVPDLLSAGAYHADLRPALGLVLGPLAAWLASANAEWDWATSVGREPRPPAWSAWKVASHRDRREMLSRLRHIDPAAGRDLVESTWSGDSARDRAAFVAALAAGLSLADERLLELARSDRSGEVRLAAAGLLARLPGSALSRRATARAAAVVEVSHAITGRRLAASPPSEATPEMIADGIDPSPPRGTGRRAWLLRQVVAAAPVAWWPSHTGLSPPELIRLAGRSDWSTALERGWTDAAVRDRDAAWIGALLERPDGADRAVFQALRPADRDRWLREHPDSPLLGAVDLVPAPWSPGLSAAARRWIAGLAVTDPRQAPEARRLMRAAAIRLEPPAGPELDLTEVHPRLLDGWDEMLETLSIRAAMRRELAEEPTS